jgi:hypothetical protein
MRTTAAPRCRTVVADAPCIIGEGARCSSSALPGSASSGARIAGTRRSAFRLSELVGAPRANGRRASLPLARPKARRGLTGLSVQKFPFLELTPTRGHLSCDDTSKRRTEVLLCPRFLIASSHAAAREPRVKISGDALMRLRGVPLEPQRDTVRRSTGDSCLKTSTSQARKIPRKTATDNRRAQTLPAERME